MAASKDRKSGEPFLAPATGSCMRGTLRSQFGETSEAIFLNSGYVYDSAEQAEARFKGDEEGYVYSRYANPTVAMFEARMCALEGADAARGTSSGMAAVAASLLCHLKTGRSCRLGARAVRQLPLYRRGPAAALRHRDHADRRARSRRLGSGGAGPTRAPSSSRRRPTRCSSWSTSRACPRSPRRPARWSWSTTCSPRRCSSGRSRSAPTSWSIRRPSISTARAAASAASCWGREEFIEEKLHNYLKHTGPSLSPFNAWVLLKGLETLPLRVERSTAPRPPPSPISSPTGTEMARVLYPGRADHPQAALAKRQMAGGGPLVAFEVKGDKAATFRVLNALSDREDQQQSRRREEPDHPSRDHDASAAHAGGSGPSLAFSTTACGFRSGWRTWRDLMDDLDQALAAAR